MGLLNVSAEQWRIANDFFRSDEQRKKLLKPGNADGFSFIKVDHKVYAMANGEYLGEGGFSKYKIAEDEDGANFAVGIRGQGIDYRVEKEIAALQLLGKFVGIMERDLGVEKQFWKNRTDKSLLTNRKTYLITQLEPGVNLFDRLYKTAPPLTKTQKLIIAVRVCQALSMIHKKGVIHADLKPDNMLVLIEGKRIHVAIVDNGFSVIIGQNKVVIDEAKGTKGYIAPEIYNSLQPRLSKKEYSNASDIYALGKMFKKDLQLDAAIYEAMIDENPENRPSLSAITSSLLNILTTMLTTVKQPVVEKLPEVVKLPEVKMLPVVEKLPEVTKPLDISTPAAPVRVTRRLPAVPKTSPKPTDIASEASTIDFRSQLASMLAIPAEAASSSIVKSQSPRPLPPRPFALRKPIVIENKVEPRATAASTFNAELEERLKSRFQSTIKVN